MMTEAMKFGGAALSGLTILVTGAGSGIGRATAVLAAEAGAHVIATDIKGQDETAAAIRQAGGRAESFALDVSDAVAWRRVVGDVVSDWGGIDGLANIAGTVSDADTILTQTDEGWRRIISINLEGPWLGMTTVVPHMLEKGAGKIINVASTAALIGIPNLMAYSASKGGVLAMSRQVAIEYAGRGLRVNMIAPGVIDTPMLQDRTEEVVAAVKAASPTNRIGLPSDVAGMIVYLLGAGSDFITGQVFVVDGGWTAQ